MTTMFAQLVLLISILPGKSDTFQTAETFQTADTFQTAESEWSSFKRNYHRHFNSKEENIRKQIFLERLKSIKLHNAAASNGTLSYRLAVNKFADWTETEMERFLCLAPVHPMLRAPATEDPVLDNRITIPPSFDWRSRGGVTQVKDQKNCGSCYAFAATGAIEGQYANRTGKLVSFSEQNILDCFSPQGHHGCGGGQYVYAFDYIKHHGLASSQAYPYTATNDKCRSPEKGVRVWISKYHILPNGDEESLKRAVVGRGPVSVAIHASQNFQHYKQGIFHDKACEGQANHAVLVVGYGSEGGVDYWIVKNSYGSGWGEKGYIRIRSQKCGIFKQPAYPVLSTIVDDTDYNTWISKHCYQLLLLCFISTFGVFWCIYPYCQGIAKSVVVRSRHTFVDESPILSRPSYPARKLRQRVGYERSLSL